MSDSNKTVEAHPVATVQEVLGALHDPVRLEMVRRLSNAGGPVRCGMLYDTINKSTATHHLKILREAGVTERIVADGQTYARLRTEEVEHALPGLLAAVVGAANRAGESGAAPRD
ncbi:ArsR family transcriptional regulator [Nocardia sp. 852002-20019_SCH5090214]|jgi:DNA-binding transcriptional ArsR family regulator|uniref:Transcriptional regulator n=1 Tax=Nocardia nova TaxID=37330 RepID=A0A2S6A9Q5_9NOCA|nr:MULTISPECIES: helix-turn-helix transcriptional regulator [Nocardia]OBF69468.1 ArsR family transcriptional regulator [Mycobacterium sp. 852002-51759_SCH5129042]MBF6274396.1 helix-turn-helix transcriptional regulator [Nocardia nova]MBV7704077.1 ArsR family transcriptional regulator [Nocardia nova]OBA54206.1 ArsR family transcriptional regulator [Nocardia sp. 852002-51101_SCH5132738]OBA62839.1 ArsR family transcriptional regulator [Nocardia sp. 852002-20019_SCH5090214]